MHCRNTVALRFDCRPQLVKIGDDTSVSHLGVECRAVDEHGNTLFFTEAEIEHNGFPVLVVPQWRNFLMTVTLRD
jgi:hypothetical protein